MFWLSHKEYKGFFNSIQKWWDFGKTQIKQLCQQFNQNVTRELTRSMKDLEIQVVEPQNLAEFTGNRGYLDSLKSRRSALANLLGITAKGALVRWRFLDATQMDAPSQFFFSLERKNSQGKIIHSLRSSSGSEISDSSEIRWLAVEFYKDLYKCELKYFPDAQSSFFSGLPRVNAEVNKKLEAQLTMKKLNDALMSMQSGGAPGTDGLSVDFYKLFWPVVCKDIFEVLTESLQRGRLPQSCRGLSLPRCPRTPCRGVTFRLQYIQRLLTGPPDLVWRPLSCWILQKLGSWSSAQTFLC